MRLKLTRGERTKLAAYAEQMGDYDLAAKVAPPQRGRPARDPSALVESLTDLHLELRAAVAAGRAIDDVLIEFETDPRVAHVAPDDRAEFLYNVWSLEGRHDIRQVLAMREIW